LIPIQPDDLDALERHVATLRNYSEMGLDEVALKLHGDQQHALSVIGEWMLPALQ